MYQLKWLKQNSEKAEINDGGDTLKLTSRAKSDFWITPTRRVLDGSFGYEEVTGDFVAQAHFIGEYHSQYDQAGLMIYLNDEHWLKAGIEMINDRQYVSSVLTTPYSDWSVVPTNLYKEGKQRDGITLRVEKKGSKVLIDYYFDSQIDDSNPEELPWVMARKITCFLPDANQALKVGLMTASPQSETGFSTTFSSFNIFKH